MKSARKNSQSIRRMVMIAIALVMDGAENIWNTMATVRVRAKKRSTFEALLPEQHNVSI